MGVDTFQYGDDIVGYCMFQDSFGTAKKPVAGSAFRAISITCGPGGPDRPLATDRRKTRSAMETVEGRQALVPWTATVLLRPSGTLGIAPDIGDLLFLAYGSEGVVASTSVTYSLLQDMSGLYCSIYKDMSSIHEGVYDAIVQSLEMRWAGDDFMRLTFSGVASNYIEAGVTTTNGTGSGSTALIVTDSDFFTKFGIIQIGSDTNSDTGYLITAIDHTTNTLTLGTAASWSSAVAVSAYLPTASLSDSGPVYGTDFELSMDGGSTSVKSISGSVTVGTGVDLLNREAGDSQASDVINATRRTVEGTLDFLVKEDETYYRSEARRSVSKDFQITLGDTAAQRMKINAATAELRPAGERTSPEEGPIEDSMAFQALGSSGEDESTLVFD